MLVLSRKRGERILVGDCEVVVTVLAVKGGSVRLGISAPADVAVYREEVEQRRAERNHRPPAKG
jgi:carbon storage regulator